MCKKTVSVRRSGSRHDVQAAITIQNDSGLPQGLNLHLMTWSNPSVRAFAMTSDPRKSLIHLDILTILVCCLLFIAAIRVVGFPLWSIPAMTLFAVAGLTLLCILPVLGDPRRFKDFGRQVG
jgi:hypothetical protein